MAASRLIQVTRTDLNKLRELIERESAVRPQEKPAHEALAGELARAEIKNSEEIDPDVITLQSRVLLRDLQTQEAMELALVLPHVADIDSGRISIMAPLGTAMLGYRQGDEFEWDMPGGKRRFFVEKVIYQPEAQGEIPESE